MCSHHHKFLDVSGDVIDIYFIIKWYENFVCVLAASKKTKQKKKSIEERFCFLECEFS